MYSAGSVGMLLPLPFAPSLPPAAAAAAAAAAVFMASIQLRTSRKRLSGLDAECYRWWGGREKR